MDKIKALVVSHQSLFQQGIQHCLSNVEDIEITTATEISDELLANIDRLPPDVAIVDIDGSDNGLTLAHRIKQCSPSVGVVILTSEPNDGQIFEALKEQAAAYLGKDITAQQLSDTIRSVARGGHPINDTLTSRPKLAEKVLHEFQDLYWRSEAEALISPLTPRETEILNFIAQGYLNKQIAGQLGISEQTIKNHVTSILRKLNANARTEAVVVAIRQGLISIQVNPLR